MTAIVCNRPGTWLMMIQGRKYEYMFKFNSNFILLLKELNIICKNKGDTGRGAMNQVTLIFAYLPTFENKN